LTTRRSIARRSPLRRVRAPSQERRCLCGRPSPQVASRGQAPPWASTVRYGDETWEKPSLAQMAGPELDDETIGAVVGALGSASRPVKFDRARIDRQMRDLALDHAAGQLEDGSTSARPSSRAAVIG
jgi:hypothetical protein